MDAARKNSTSQSDESGNLPPCVTYDVRARQHTADPGLGLVIFALFILRLLFFFKLRSSLLWWRSAALRLSRLGLGRSLLAKWRCGVLFPGRWRCLTRRWLSLLAGRRCLLGWGLRLLAGGRCLMRWWLGLLAGRKRLTRGWLSLLTGRGCLMHLRLNLLACLRCLMRWWLGLLAGRRRLTRGWLSLLTGRGCLMHLRLNLLARVRCLMRWWLGLLAGRRCLTHLWLGLHGRRRLTRWWLRLLAGGRRTLRTRNGQGRDIRFLVRLAELCGFGAGPRAGQRSVPGPSAPSE